MFSANASQRSNPSPGVRFLVEQELDLWQAGLDSVRRKAAFAEHERPSLVRLIGAPPDSSPRRIGCDDPLADFWRSLAGGKLRVVDAFSKRESCCTIAVEQPDPEAPFALDERERVLLHRTLQGETQKVLAAGFDLSVAAISQLLGGTLRKIGLSGRVGCTPLPIVLTVLGSSGVVAPPAVYRTEINHDGLRYVAMGLPALDSDALPRLSHAERNVALLHVRGNSYGKIAEERRTSPRTIANQIAALSKKLEIRGRFDLIQFWAELQWGNAGFR